ncbi:transporter substrate-binding domain-containing protein [Dechloromonas sp. TW-R-39-2]|uniref:substrate-binding periplasmic protein n=1 Tax=Dechloromonas sp. TW-R-39-2 TaxID=2654218 RepID=UPI00193E88B9|nr:transporter substrate-binding domain-containing protein [Dechloromonas sp. TW-R-39-2]QRM18729.1 transporter substrate-binding domain-containing protein [Dechloromonas sp. TW-R-39-2]
MKPRSAALCTFRKQLAFVALALACISGAMATELTILSEEWPPITFSNNKVPDGMAVEVVNAIQARLGNPQAIAIVPFARAYSLLLSTPNIMLFTIGRSDEREKLMTLLGPIAIAKTQVFTRKGNAARLIAQGDAIHKLPISTYRHSIFAKTAEIQGFTAIELAATPQITANMLMRGRVEMWVDGSLAIPAILKEAGYSIDDVEPVMTLDSLELYLAFSPGTNSQTINAWEKTLRDMKQDGTFGRIHQKWLGREPVPLETRRLGLSPR